MARRVQRRSGTSSQIAAMTPAARELIVDTTTLQLVLGNGVTLGGAARFLNATDVNALFSGGNFLPALTNTANITASTAYTCQYIQLADRVVAFGKVAFDPELTTTLTKLRIGLPVVSTIAAEEDIAGVAFCADVASVGAAIRGVVGLNTAAELVFTTGADVANRSWFFVFGYVVNG